MSAVDLLDKTRKIGKLLHNNNFTKLVFNDVCSVMTEVLDANILVISRKGKVLGKSMNDKVYDLGGLLSANVGERVDMTFNDRLLNVLSTKENVNLIILGFKNDEIRDHNATICPVEIAGKRLGTLFVYRQGNPFDIEDIILCEYGSTVVGLETMRSVSEEMEEEKRKSQMVTAAISTLSFTERQAIRLILAELDGDEGVLIASRVADAAGITRSVIVNAMRKLESAGVLESRSSGMKGTRIKILNDTIFEEINNYPETNDN
ncbi:MAG: GTP-sensing pleiotropic transcriptional regulator CodY [Clostridiales bacterium]|nr:GTP-sensing pleiotropic transcriptional regulator CodY [Clostridiales bacterium]